MPNWVITLADRTIVTVSAERCDLAESGLVLTDRDNIIVAAFAADAWRMVVQHECPPEDDWPPCRITPTECLGTEHLRARLQEGALADGFTRRDVRRHQWRHLTDDKTIETALALLETDGWIRSRAQRIKAGGRPTTRYFINPKLDRRRVASGDTRARRTRPRTA